MTANDVQILWEKFNSVVTVRPPPAEMTRSPRSSLLLTADATAHGSTCASPLRLPPCAQFGFPSAGGFSAGLAYAASGSFVKAAVGAGVGASGLALGTAHLYQNTDWLPPILQRSAPGISKRLDHAAEHAAEQGSFVRRGLERGWGGAGRLFPFLLPSPPFFPPTLLCLPCSFSRPVDSGGSSRPPLSPPPALHHDTHSPPNRPAPPRTRPHLRSDDVLAPARVARRPPVAGG